jgi:hypothetical protein
MMSRFVADADEIKDAIVKGENDPHAHGTSDPTGHGAQKHDCGHTPFSLKADGKTASKRPLYVARDVLNGEDIVAWAKSQGFEKTLIPDDIHVTVCFSKEPVDWSETGDSFDHLQSEGSEGRSIEQFNGGAVVLRFELKELSDRWQELRDQGASWDFDEYHPHVTLTYDAGDLDLSKIEPYDGLIKLGPEKFKELDLDWKDKVAEKHDHGPDCGHTHLAKASVSGKVYPDPLRPFAARHEKALALQLKATLAKLGKKVAKQVKDALAKVVKAEYPDDLDIDALLASLDLDVLSLSQDDIAEALTALYGDAGRIAVSQLGSTVDANSIVEQVNERALSWARDRAAELVSFDDTDPILAQTTRDMIRADIADGIENNLSTGQIGDILEENYAFSEERADLIAATEITSANSMGSLASYEEAADMGITVQKSWLVLEDGCPVCQENADAGPIDLDEEFPSGDMAPGAHPNCRCVLVPEVTDEQGNVTEGEAEDTSEE